MSIEFSCPSCGQSYRPRPDRVGKKIRCKCGAISQLFAQVPSDHERDIPVPTVRRSGVDAMATQIRDLEDDGMPASSIGPRLPLDYLGAPQALQLNVDVMAPPAMELSSRSFEVEVDPEDTELDHPRQRAILPSPIQTLSREEAMPQTRVAQLVGGALMLLVVGLWALSALYAAGFGDGLTQPALQSPHPARDTSNGPPVVSLSENNP